MPEQGLVGAAHLNNGLFADYYLNEIIPGLPEWSDGNLFAAAKAALLLLKMAPDMAAEARQLAYRLYSICERKGWAEHARDYNALVISWSGIGEVASQEREAAAQGEATRQGRLFEDL